MKLFYRNLTLLDAERQNAVGAFTTWHQSRTEPPPRHSQDRIYFVDHLRFYIQVFCESVSLKARFTERQTAAVSDCLSQVEFKGAIFELSLLQHNI